MSEITKDQLASIYYPLRLTYGLVPIVAGLDKFFHLLADWDKYLPAFAADVLPLSTSTFMQLVGIIEIVAGLAVLTLLTRLGAYIVTLWLTLIAVNLIAAGYLDIAVRDLVMAVGAFTLAQVAALRGEHWLSPTSDVHRSPSRVSSGSATAVAK
jgi:uncharacterized membrane protein YphA (DoxX/SURF4 family)